MNDLLFKKTVLYALHKKLGAQMTEFNHWSMPLQYSSIVEEHLAVRERAGIFDVSHMGIFSFEGADVFAGLNAVIANDLRKIDIGHAIYSPLLYENGTFVDDVIVYLISKTKAWMVVNAGNLEKDYLWIERHIKKKGYRIQQEKMGEHALLALQGPQVWEVLEKLCPKQTIYKASSFALEFCEYEDKEVMLAKTGYTGEAGVEVFLPASVASSFFEAAVKLGVVPCGLGARDSLRLEKGYSLYGHEITDKTNALEAGLGWATGFNKEAFIGKQQLLKVKADGIKRRICGFVLEGRMVARSGCRVLEFGGEKQIGVVTSGGFSPVKKKSIGLAYIDVAYSGKKVEIEVRGKRIKAELGKRVFV